MKNFTIADKNIFLVESSEKNSPLVILHTYATEGEQVFNLTKNLTDKNFSFAAISNLNWNDEMSPWAIPPIAKNDTPCTGGADKYLATLTEKILPEILKQIQPKYLALAGYSLAGLFAVYSAYKTKFFLRIASASGSFWFPNFVKFTQENNLQIQPEKIYFSLGDKESKTKNKILQPVEENTVALKNFYAELGIETTFELNFGNHFQDGALRMAKGIAWILN